MTNRSTPSIAQEPAGSSGIRSVAGHEVRLATRSPRRQPKRRPDSSTSDQLADSSTASQADCIPTGPIQGELPWLPPGRRVVCSLRHGVPVRFEKICDGRFSIDVSAMGDKTTAGRIGDSLARLAENLLRLHRGGEVNVERHLVCVDNVYAVSELIVTATSDCESDTPDLRELLDGIAYFATQLTSAVDVGSVSPVVISGEALQPITRMVIGAEVDKIRSECKGQPVGGELQVTVDAHEICCRGDFRSATPKKAAELRAGREIYGRLVNMQTTARVVEVKPEHGALVAIHYDSSEFLRALRVELGEDKVFRFTVDEEAGRNPQHPTLALRGFVEALGRDGNLFTST